MATDHVAQLGALSVDQMWERLRGEFLNEYVRLERMGLPAAEIERELLDFMDKLSQKPVEALGRQGANVAYNQGRSAAILEEAADGEVEYVVRSEALDDPATCEECRRLDGAVFEVGTDEFYRYMPPAFCRGRENCRGFYIAFPAESAGAA